MSSLWPDPMPEPQYEEQEIDDPQALLEFFDRKHPRWQGGDGWSSPWVFRGQRCAKWGLDPKAWRQDDQDVQDILEPRRRAMAEVTTRPGDTQLDTRLLESDIQERAEISLLRDFVELSNELGLNVPHDYPLRPGFEDPKPGSLVGALAAHHGVPTRLLDFSRNPRVAAFWALEDASEDDDSHIAMWALKARHQPLGPLKPLTVPRSSNERLHVQDGLFLHFARPQWFYASFGEWPAFEACGVEPAGQILKVTHPIRDLERLRHLLHLEGITRAHMTNSYDGVTEALRYRWTLGH